MGTTSPEDCAEDCAEVDRNGSTMLRLSSVLQHRAIRCGIPSMPAISAMPPTDALLGKHTLSTFAGYWTSTQHGGRGAIIKFGTQHTNHTHCCHWCCDRQWWQLTLLLSQDA